MNNTDISIKTIVADGNDNDSIKTAAKILNNEGLVAFPTETVYGLGADALNPIAAAKIYAAKGRPSDNPLIVHIADTDDVYKLASNVPEKAKQLMEAFWPGPLTIILPKKPTVPDGTTGGLNTVAIRMPSHPVALSLIKESGVYIAAPSANTSGRPSPTEASHVIADMDGKIEMILDGGAVGIGIESTIVDLTEAIPTILRPGFITKSMLENIIGEVTIDKALIEPAPDLRPKAPGMKYTHYAPKGELTIIEACNESSNENYSKNDEINCIDNYSKNDEINCVDNYSKNNGINSIDNCINDHEKKLDKVIAKINELVKQKTDEGYKVAVIATSENAASYKCENVLTVGANTDGATIAAKLYGTLRKCDDIGADYIYSEAFDKGELGGAIMNRLLKAAGHRVIKL